MAATQLRVTGVTLALVLIYAGCATTPVDPPPQEPVLTAAPWAGPHLPASAVPRFYGEQWRRAENRTGCAPIAPAALGEGEGATPRAANFSGGWAVAYDTPEIRSAFGVAGTGSSAGDATYEWADNIHYRDGSGVSYGPEGGTGPNQLAYLRIAGQGCLYNVWSRLGEDHLVYLLGQLRFVDVP